MSEAFKIAATSAVLALLVQYIDSMKYDYYRRQQSVFEYRSTAHSYVVARYAGINIAMVCT